MRTQALAPLALLIAITACSGNPPAQPAPQPAAAPVAPPATPSTPAAAQPAPAPSTAPAPAAAPADLTGEWTWTLELGSQVIAGVMTVARSGNSYSGQVVPDGMSAGAIRSVTVNGDRVVIVADAPDGQEATMETTLTADRRAMSGILNYNGQVGSFTARRR